MRQILYLRYSKISIFPSYIFPQDLEGYQSFSRFTRSESIKINQGFFNTHDYVKIQDDGVTMEIGQRSPRGSVRDKIAVSS
jgi:hypothetical protein